MLKNLHTGLKRTFISFIVLVQAFGFTAFVASPTVFADDTTAASSAAAVSSATCPTSTGTTSPTGSAAHTFTFNTSTCQWENTYYSWDPVSKVYTALYDQTPVYNASTNTWDHIQWDYSPASGAYKSHTISVPAAPLAAAAVSPTTAAGTASSPSAHSQTSGSATINNTGSNSNNSIEDNSLLDADINITNNSSVLNTMDSSANSGDAFVLQNTNGGDATSGDAAVIANVLNMLQSSWDPVGNNFGTFVADLYGKYTGDLLFDPGSILNTGSGSSNTMTDNSTTDLTVNVQDNASIVNDLDLTATTGNAAVSGNTNAGNATSGDANVLANLINMINSSINADAGFVGTINIFGELAGDILLPQALQAMLMNTGANSNNQITDNSDTNIDADLNTDYSITNNTNLTASTGDALVDGNTNAGSALTGTASTNLNQMNLIGKNVTGTKGLLVMVNVLGQWQGMILQVQPYNYGIIGTGQNSNNQITNNSSTNANINVNRDYDIVNNLTLNAASGDATVSGNTNAGNAKTGNATATVNSLNMIDSNMQFSDWFGVLFINVFGQWNGSFGVDTSAGGKGGGVPGGGSSSPGTSSPNASSGGVLGANTRSLQNRNFASSFQGYGYVTGQNSSSTNTNTPSDSADSTGENNATPNDELATATTQKSGLSWWITGSAIVLAILFLTGDKLYALLNGWLASRRS